jgi:hypothetical protein
MPVVSDTIAVIGAHGAVTMQIPWAVAWLLGALLLTGLGTIILQAAELWDTLLRRVGVR